MQLTDGNSEDTLNEACAKLFELLSKSTSHLRKPIAHTSSPFENGEPVFTLSEADRILEAAYTWRSHWAKPLAP